MDSHDISLLRNASDHADGISSPWDFTVIPKVFRPVDNMGSAEITMNVSIELFNSSLNSVNSSEETDSTDVKYSMMSAYISLGVLTVLMNIFVLVVIYRYTWMRTNTNIIIASMAVTDLVAGSLAFISGIVKWGELFEVGTIFCLVFNIADVTVAHASLYHVLAVNAERYLAIIKPLKYTKLFTKRLLYLYIAIIWIVSLGLALMYVLNMNYIGLCLADVPKHAVWTLTTLILTFPLPLFIIIGIYIHIVIVTLHHLRFLKEHSANRLSCKGKIKKMVKSVGTIFAVYLACWGPTFCVLIAINLSILIEQELDFSNLVTMFYFFEVCAYANSLFNPIIYFIGSRKFQKAAKKMFGLKHDSSSSVHSQGPISPASSVVNIKTEVTRF